MSEPWLSDLSEDWKTPSSVGTSSPPNGPRPISASSTTSRIPRSTKMLSSPASTRSKAPVQTTSKRTLSERSHSEINIPPQSSSVRRPAKPASRISRSSSASSVGSVVKLGTAARKAKSNSPAKSKNATPEWKKLVLMNQNDPAQTNLFSPMGLEGIFQRPPAPSNDEQPRPRPSFSFLQDLDSMPSSPPPWPKSHRGSHLSCRPGSGGQELDSLGVLKEQEEDEILPSTVSANNEMDIYGDEVSSHVDTSSLPVHGRRAVSASTPSTSGLDGSSDVEPPSNHEESQIRDCDDSFNHQTDTSNDEVKESSSLSGKNTSSVVGGFSPVFISKHNTADGHVDYAAVDLSNPEVVQRLRDSHGFRSSTAHDAKPDQANAEYLTREDLPNLGALDHSFNTSWTRDQLKPIIEFVNLGRGGHSDEDSFMHRPLSPSASSSIVPSDSVSQIHAPQDRNQEQFPRPAYFQARPPERSSENEARISQSLSINPVRLNVERPSGDQAEKLSLPMPEERTHQNTHDPSMNDAAASVSNNYQTNVFDTGFDTASQGASGAEGSLETVLHRSISDRSDHDVTISLPVLEERDFSAKECTKTLDANVDGAVERPSTPQRDLGPTTDSSPNKRTAPLPSKSPTPKRLRTLSELERIERPEFVSDIVEEQHRRMQAIIGKRKDARYDDFHRPCAPEELAKREILRPRNLAPAQRLYTELKDSFQGSVNSTNTLRTVHEHIELANLDCDIEEEAKIKALASDVATMRLRGLDRISRMNGEVRKHSVSTQDYVDEAMKIMELIRSNRMPQTGLSNLSESDGASYAEVEEDAIEEMTPQTISRPPSREGMVNAWRTKESKPLNAEVASQLKRFEENGDESFVATSTFEDLQSRIGGFQSEHDQTPVDEESADIRILGHLIPLSEELDTNDPDHAEKTDRQSQGLPKTYNSNKSTNSSGRTVETTSTQKTRTLPVIVPDKISHLLRTEQAGMRYDAERQTWVKCKTTETRATNAENLSSSNNTDEDPFGAISDLSVNDDDFGGPMIDQADVPLPDLENSGVQDELDFGSVNGSYKDDEFELADQNNALVLSDSTLDNREGESDIARSGEDADKMCPHTRYHDLEGQLKAGTNIPTPMKNFAQPPTGGKQSQKRNVSVLFSSPPVAEQYAPQHWSDLSEQSEPDASVLGRDHIPATRAIRRSTYTGASPCRGINPAGFNFNTLNREMSLSCIDERHEISFVGTRPDGRSMSLTLSVSTPLPAHRESLRPILPSSGLRNSSFWQSLSPLSEFSMHQDDSRHLKSRQLFLDNNQALVPSRANKSAVVVETLVQKLTDVEPDEPYWDFMRALGLKHKKLSNLYMLDEFCPRIEELDVSENALQHLNGAPRGLRQLDVRNNCLSSLSSWEHLANLQYLDISGNGIESLEAFSNLVHLRELKMDDNNVTSLEGLLDLDGLLCLSLRRNKLKQVDFHGAALKRLSTLNLEGNILERISNLDGLPSLEHFNISNNQLNHFPSAEDHISECHKIQSLNVARNRLESLDVSVFPNLRCLDADENRLVRIGHVNSLLGLQFLFIRAQKPPPKDSNSSIADSLDDYSEVQHLHLSGNFIPKPNICTPFLNLKTLELACAGVQSLPWDLGRLAPNLRAVNLNSNSLKDLRPLRRIRKLVKLFVAANRLSRLRKTMRVIESLPLLQELDLRDNPLTLGYYPFLSSDQTQDRQAILRFGDNQKTQSNDSEQQLLHLLPLISASDKNGELELLQLDHLDDDTRLRRRLYELLLAAKCPNLELMDGRRIERERIFKTDGTWQQLVDLGVIERVEGGEEDVC